MGKEVLIIGENFQLIKQKIKGKNRKNSEKFNLIALDYMNIGWYIIIPILFFLGVGLIIQKFLIKSSLVVLVFLFLGVVSSFYNVFKLIGWKR